LPKSPKRKAAHRPRRAARAKRGAPSAKIANKTPNRTTRQSVLAAAKALQATIRAGNAAAAEQFLARDFSFIDAAGHEHARREVLNALKASPRSAGAQVRVRDYGRVALITGSYKSAQAGERSDLFALDVWVKDGRKWKALIHHNNVLARPDAPSAHASAAPRPMDAPPPRCVNPLEQVPYRPNSQAERDIIAAFQALELAVTRNDPDEWTKHVADEFVVTRTRQHPTDKTARMAFMATQRAINAETFVAEVVSLRFWVLGDAAIMRADHAMPGNRRPPYRATRLWLKRGARWQMAISQQTTIQP
jgi:ketosteroid isomerase-like protein